MRNLSEITFLSKHPHREFQAENVKALSVNNLGKFVTEKLHVAFILSQVRDYWKWWASHLFRPLINQVRIALPIHIAWNIAN